MGEEENFTSEELPDSDDELSESSESSEPPETKIRVIEAIPGKLGVTVNWTSNRIKVIGPQAQRCFRKIEEGWRILTIDGKKVSKELLKKKSKGKRNCKITCEGI